MLEFSIHDAQRSDLEAALSIVRDAGLPIEGVYDAFPEAYIVARSGVELIAVAGLERHGDVGLLRSVAVRSRAQGLGLGKLLVADRLRQARLQKLKAVYLLTTSAADFFRQLGFQDAAREAVPDALKQSSEFAAVCPSSAVCLVRRFD